jgi:hypothetical protein
MNKLKMLVLATTALLYRVVGFTQTTPTTPLQPEADMMRSNGKIYVVMMVVIVIVTGLFMYLFAVDRKVTRLEQKSK